MSIDIRGRDRVGDGVRSVAARRCASRVILGLVAVLGAVTVFLGTAGGAAALPKSPLSKSAACKLVSKKQVAQLWHASSHLHFDPVTSYARAPFGGFGWRYSCFYFARPIPNDSEEFVDVYWYPRSTHSQFVKLASEDGAHAKQLPGIANAAVGFNELVVLDGKDLLDLAIGLPYPNTSTRDPVVKLSQLERLASDAIHNLH